MSAAHVDATRESTNTRTTTSASAPQRAGIAQLARARAFQARGRGFESRFPLQATGQKEESAHVAQVVEHVLGKDEVSGSSPLVSSREIDSRAGKLGQQSQAFQE